MEYNGLRERVAEIGESKPDSGFTLKYISWQTELKWETPEEVRAKRLIAHNEDEEGAATPRGNDESSQHSGASESM